MLLLRTFPLIHHQNALAKAQISGEREKSPSEIARAILFLIFLPPSPLTVIFKLFLPAVDPRIASGEKIKFDL